MAVFFPLYGTHISMWDAQWAAQRLAASIPYAELEPSTPQGMLVTTGGHEASRWLREWSGASGRSLGLLTLGLVVLVGSTVVIGFGNSLVAHD
jgi:hypothetical protein